MAAPRTAHGYAHRDAHLHDDAVVPAQRPLRRDPRTQVRLGDAGGQGGGGLQAWVRPMYLSAFEFNLSMGKQGGHW